MEAGQCFSFYNQQSTAYRDFNKTRKSVKCDMFHTASISSLLPQKQSPCRKKMMLLPLKTWLQFNHLGSVVLLCVEPVPSLNTAASVSWHKQVIVHLCSTAAASGVNTKLGCFIREMSHRSLLLFPRLFFLMSIHCVGACLLL